MFYASAERISAEIQSAIDSVGFGKVENLAQQVCDCLQRTPQNFGCIELKVTESKEVFDITYPDAVMMVVSCVDDKSASTKPPQRYMYIKFYYHKSGNFCVTILVVVDSTILVARLHDTSIAAPRY